MLKQLFLFVGVFLLFELQAQKKNDPVLRLSFDDGEIRDETGNNFIKGYNTLPTEDRFGNKNAARYFQGNGDSYINLGNNQDVKPLHGTISLWVKIEQAVFKGKGFPCNPIIFTRSRLLDDFNEAYAIYYNFDTHKLNCNTGRSEINSITIYPAETTYFGQWYHITMSYDSCQLKLYINGLLEGQAAKNFESCFLNGDSVLIGTRFGDKNVRYFQGSIDDIVIFNRVLNAKEVLALYNARDPRETPAVVKWGLIVLSVSLVLAVLAWGFKWRVSRTLRAEQEKNKLKNSWYEQENRVLTAQMDPHFIFNSLNTIQQFIIVNENEKAQLYLSKFSRLLRMILENNMKDNVSLSEELEIIKKYLEIESLRFNNAFSYELKLTAGMRASSIRIPRFLIQPFVENAIWHGLLPKDGERLLSLSFTHFGEKTLECIVEDNGVGRKEKESEGKEVARSFAINFIQQRLKLMSRLYKEEYEIQILDKLDSFGNSAGTKVIIKIPILQYT